MAILNLISPEQNKQLQLKYLTSVLTNFCGMLVLAIILFGIVAVAFKNQIEQIKTLNDGFLQTEYQKHNYLINDIDNFNKNLDNLAKISSSAYNWNKLFISLPTLKPEGIFLTTFDASITSDRSIIIKGFAKTRDALIAFQNNLNQSGFFESIDSPLSNFTQSQDVDFVLNGKLK